MTTQTIGTRFLAGAVLAGSLAVTGVALTPGVAEARCNALSMCSQVWCPGRPLPVGGSDLEPTVTWDMNACHTWSYGFAGRTGSTNGQVEVGWRIMEGEPSPVPGLY